MRISKLFHWLYAFLIMLPIFAVGSKILYVTINQNAKESYSALQYEYETNVITSKNDMELNAWYHFDSREYDDSANLIFFRYSDIKNVVATNFNSSDYETVLLSNRLGVYLNGNIQVANDNNGDVTNILWYDINAYTIQFDCFITAIPNFTSTASGFVSINIINQSNLDNVFYYAVEQVKNNPLFSWVNTSAVYTPIAYGSALFGVPSNSAINTYLAYWLNVSIIWLMFDVLIYVPLLAHRWLDKGIRE